MAEKVDVDSSLAKKRRTEKEEDKKPSTLASMFDDDDDDDDEYVPLTEESKQQISDFKDRFEKSGGFNVPKISHGLLDRVAPQIERTDPGACLTDERLINVVNTAISHHKKKKKNNNNNYNKMMDLVLVEILSAASELCGNWQDYITFKARDSAGAVRTYETLINPRFSDEEVILEIFRVKPYTGVEYPERNKVERPRMVG